LILWVAGYLFCAVTPVMEHPLLAFGFEVILFVGGSILLTRKSVGGRLSARGIITVIVSLALSLSMVLTTNKAIINCVYLWNCLAWFYLVFTATGNSRERAPGQYFVGELLTATFAMPFKAPANLFSALFGARKNPDGTPRPRKGSATLGWILLGLVIAFIPTLIVGLLLSYDDGFSSIMDNILDEIFSADEIFRQLRNIGLGILVGALMFGAILAGKHRKGKKTDPAEAPASTPALPKSDGAHVLPVAMVAATLTPILIIYIIFFVSQWDYYVSAFTGVRPEELTFSDYAREGFFQLLAVAVINAILSLGASLLTKRRPENPDKPNRDRTHPVTRIYMAVMALSTLILIATAVAKMLLYVDTYGMTHKRTYATWLMLLLAVCFVAVILRQLFARMNLTGTLLAVFLVFFVAISVVNVDSLIMKYNANAALDGNLRTMQGEVLEDCGYAGVLPALEFMETTEQAGYTPETPVEFSEEQLARVRANTEEYLTDSAKKLEKMKWYEHNLVTLRAREALRDAGYEE
ncbi:MAG: DUF4173 domain-containing protein, partial [Clostridia bacterium]|nr:DUF4173 domain-containing protein [Clostridia bacterium]